MALRVAVMAFGTTVSPTYPSLPYTGTCLAASTFSHSSSRIRAFIWTIVEVTSRADSS
jgi:hypothetical protein